jgi:drug/metabolite transporter (DMT)-like permease
MGTIPVFTFAIAALVRQERFSLRRGLGTLVALAGVATLFYGKGAELRSEYLTGNLLMVTNALCYAAYIVAAKPLLQRYPPLVVITWIFLLSAWLVPIYGIGQDWTPADTTQEALLSLGYVLIFPTVLAYLLHTFALTHVASTTTAIYIYLQPVIATLAGIWILGEEPGLHVFVAALGIFGGLALVLWKKPRNRSEPRTTP